MYPVRTMMFKKRVIIHSVISILDTKRVNEMMPYTIN